MAIGRPKGSKNKKTHAEKKGIEAKLLAMGCDPIVGMARIALDCERELQILDTAIKESDDALVKSENIRCKGTHMTMAGNMYKELAQYVAPKRKAVEVSGDLGLNHTGIESIEITIVDEAKS